LVAGGELEAGESIASSAQTLLESMLAASENLEPAPEDSGTTTEDSI